MELGLVLRQKAKALHGNPYHLRHRCYFGPLLSPNVCMIIAKWQEEIFSTSRRQGVNVVPTAKNRQSYTVSYSKINYY